MHGITMKCLLHLNGVQKKDKRRKVKYFYSIKKKSLFKQLKKYNL